MTTYSYAQLEGLWVNAGGSPALAPVMAAVAEAESGGNPNAVNATDNHGTQTSWGLWQISDGTHNQPVANILSPAVNAQQAVAKYKSQGLSAWGTYTSGAYKAFLSGSTTPDTNVPGSGSAGGSSTSATTTAALSSSAAAACLVQMPSINLVITSVGGGCLFTKSEARAFIGAALLATGAAIGLLAVLVLAAGGFDHTGAGKAVTKAAGVVGVAL